MYEHFANVYNEIFPFDDTMEKYLVDYIKPKGKAVDLGCGTGRLVKLLSQMDMRVIGVDLDFHMINQAKNDFPDLTFIHSNMVAFLDKNDKYDLITCFGNTLPHLEKQELIHFFERAIRSLNKDGVMLIQLLNYQKILRKKPDQLNPITFKKGSFNRFYQYHQYSITFTTKLEFNGIKSEDSTTLYPYTQEELRELFENIGITYMFTKSLNELYEDHDSDHLTIILRNDK